MTKRKFYQDAKLRERTREEPFQPPPQQPLSKEPQRLNEPTEHQQFSWELQHKIDGNNIVTAIAVPGGKVFKAEPQPIDGETVMRIAMTAHSAEQFINRINQRLIA